MWKFNPLFSLFCGVLLCYSPTFILAHKSSGLWQTLDGDTPIVIARGGFSGLFPDSSSEAYLIAVRISAPDLVSWCDVQLTRDGNGICFPDVNLDNASYVVSDAPPTTYFVNGKPISGHFTVDFTAKDLQLVTMRQRNYIRSPVFDGTQNIRTVDDVISLIKPHAIWLNIQHDAFFSQHNLSMRNYVISLSKRSILSYISSPELNFLTSIASRFKPPTKLIFRFLEPDAIEPSTNQTYGSLLKNLTFIKTFASGILVPKSYIRPVGSDMYLRPPTSLVSDAHKLGLEIHASEFANDARLAYDYSSDPVSEYLSYIDNGSFSVDGLLSDFPSTLSATIDCFSHMSKNDTTKAEYLIISSEGSSAKYPGCSDNAYNQAIEDGVDIIDCPVQMSEDGVPFCMGSINLVDRTDASESPFTNVTKDIPELGIQGGIFAFNLTWTQIETLHPTMYSPFGSTYKFFRNPRANRNGSIVQLSQFLNIAKNASSASGVLINIEHAAFLAQSAGLDVVEAVLDTLNGSGYNHLKGKTVYIQSSDSAVLKQIRIRKTNNYKLVYMVDETISDVTNTTISEIKKFSDAVVVIKRTIFPVDNVFILTGTTEVAAKFQALGVPVYVQLFQNEHVSQAYDFFADPYVEINSYTSQPGVEGVITPFPLTSSRLRKNRCLAYKDKPAYMLPSQPGMLIPLMNSVPPAEAPSPVLNESDVVEPPLPPVAARTASGIGAASPATPTPAPNAQCIVAANTILSSFAILVAANAYFI